MGARGYPMKILAIADEPSPRLWGEQVKRELEGVDLILSAGDLPARYLSYLTCFTSSPIVYVRGNHDDHYEQVPPEGCLCAEDTVVMASGLRILGLGGSMRYRPDGKNMYSEQEMAARIRKLRFRLRMTGGFDILLAHAPIRGCGDQPDLCHQGFACFGPLLDRHRPAVMIHGHVHQSYTTTFQHLRDYNGIPVINAYTKYVFELPETPASRGPNRLGQRLLRKASEL